MRFIIFFVVFCLCILDVYGRLIRLVRLVRCNVSTDPLSTRGRCCSCSNVNMMAESETSYSLVQVMAAIEWTQL